MRVALAALVVTAFVQVARADDGVLAELYFRAGEQAYQAQSFGAAAQDFDEAYKHKALPEIAFSAAHAYRRQYRVDPKPEYVVRAIALYRIYLDHVKTGGRVGDAIDGITDMQHELDKLIKAGIKVSDELAAEHTQLGVDVSFGAPNPVAVIHEVNDRSTAPAHAMKVTLDGTPVEPYALINVAPGKHVFHVESDGYAPRDKDALAVQGATTMIEAELAPLPARIAVTTEPGARIAIDGHDAGVAHEVEVPAGDHTITILRHGRVPVVRELAVANGQRVELEVPLALTVKRRVLPWVAGVAGTLVVATAITGTIALVAERDANDISHRATTLGNLDASARHDYDDDRSRLATFVPATWILGGAAMAAIAASATLYWLDDPTLETPRVLPTVSATGVSASLVGHF